MPDVMHLLRLEASPARVFGAISTTAGVRGWWTDDADIEPLGGGVGHVRFYGGSKVTELRVRDVSPPGRLVWDVPASFRPEWVNTVIIFELSADGEGTQLLLSHRGYPAADKDYALCTTGWATYLGRLKALVEDGQPRREEREWLRYLAEFWAERRAALQKFLKKKQ